MFKAVAVLAGFFVLIGLAWFAALKLGLLKAPGEKGGGTASKPGSPSYRVRDCVLGAGERAFLPALHEAVRLAWATLYAPSAMSPVIFPSVRLAEVLAINGSRTGDAGAWQSAFNQISSKQVDFVVCDPATTRPLLVVELDDRSHDRADRRNRDSFLDRACAAAALPILHVRAASTYDARELALQIKQILSRPR